MIEDTVERWLAIAVDKWVDLVVAGRIFGGRYGESPQLPTTAQYVHSVLEVHFETTEKLTITDPNSVSLGTRQELVIADAAEVRFGWHYYGRPQTEENWCEQVYVRDGDQVELTRSGPLQPGKETFTYSGRELVVLIPWAA